MIQWEKSGKWIRDGNTVIGYQGVGTDLQILSVKEQIPHANRPGTWEHTTYVVVQGTKMIVKRNTLKDAKAFAEELAAGAET